MKLLVLILIMCSFLPLLAAGGERTNALIMALTPLLVAIASPLLIRLFRKLGIDISNSTIEPILIQIIEIISSVEKNGQASGAEKKGQVVALTRALLSAADQKTLINRYGSLETAVQAAFERSTTAWK